MAALAAYSIHHTPALAAKLPPERVVCTAFAPPACMAPEMAAACRDYVTSVILQHDIVPRWACYTVCSLSRPRCKALFSDCTFAWASLP